MLFIKLKTSLRWKTTVGIVNLRPQTRTRPPPCRVLALPSSRPLHLPLSRPCHRALSFLLLLLLLLVIVYIFKDDARMRTVSDLEDDMEWETSRA